MKTADIIDWLRNWLSQQASISNTSATGDTNFFEAGWVDSLEIIELIDDIETKFKIRFSADDFQDRRFPTMNGLAEIIVARQKERSSDADIK